MSEPIGIRIGEMLRTVVSFEPAEKAWLDREAKLERVSMTEVVRKALKFYRSSFDSKNVKKSSTFSQLLHETAGCYQKINGLKFQEQLREEWGQ